MASREMDLVSTPESQRGLRWFLPALAAMALLLLAIAPGVSAFKVISTPGEGAGQIQNPEGLAVDFETGRLYVADQASNRIAVFDATGAFLRAFGWGVKTGASEFEVCTTSCRKGIAGDGKGQFNHPGAIAVDNDPASPSFHDVYVADTANNRIQKFDPEGNFILTFGGGVNKTVTGNVCTAASGDVCGEGSDGFGEGEFSTSERGIFVGVGPGGTVYVVDSLKSGGEKYRLQKFDPAGALTGPQHLLFEGGVAYDLAVDSVGDFYVSHGPAIRKYDASGTLPPRAEIQTPSGAIAVNGGDNHLFSVSGGVGPGVSIVEFDSAATPVRRFGYGSFERFATGLTPYQSPSGDIYASEGEGFSVGGSRVLHLDIPDPGPLVFPQPCSAAPLGNTKATLNAEVNPEGKATSFHFEYITDATYQKDVAELGPGHGFDHATATAESESIGSDFTLHKASAQAAVVPEAKYHCRVIATNADAPAGNTGPEGTFTALAALEIGSTWATDVEVEAATLNATVNPLGIQASGYFQYVEEATYEKDVAELGPGHGFDHAQKAPDPAIEFGSGESFKLGAATISGLKAGTSYRYRMVATDVKIAPEGKEIAGPTQTFRTFGLSTATLPDNRAFELVSPAQKNSAEVAIPAFGGGAYLQEGSVRIQAAAGSGEAVTYTSFTSFGKPEGAPSTSQYLARRSATGWSTENVSPFGFNEDPVKPPYVGFTPDLGFGAFVISEPPLTPDAQEGFENLYLRDNETGTLQALTIEAPVPAEGQGFCAGYAGASADGSHAIFAAKAAMAGAPLGKGFSLYEWSAANGLQVVSVLPDGTPTSPVQTSEQPGEGTGFGAAGGNCKTGQAIVRNAISEDGSTIFWTYGGKYKESERPLMARIDGSETIQLDAKVAGEKAGGKGKFWAATGDGAKAFFTAPGKLTTTAKGENQLYRYDTEARSLLDLTPGKGDPEVQGVIGASEDGTYAYFVAKGALTGEAQSPAGLIAEAGKNNLYAWHEGEGLRFIGGLSGFDENDWSSSPVKLSARITPDGRHLAFVSIETQALSDYDNTIASGLACQPNNENSALEQDPHCPQAYLYDADADSLTCVSCNPSRARPAGPAQLPAWTNPYAGPRYLSDDGSRLFFESRDVLSAADQNKYRDIYEFERAGTGSCTSESPGFDATSDGCLSLISGGESSDESYLLDASADGRDVFFSTRSALTGWDTNENYDVYDARIGGGFPEPSQQPACLGEACKAPPGGAPATSAPATPSFQGPGNAVQKPGKKHKAKKHKKKSRHKVKKAKGKANRERGTGR